MLIKVAKAALAAAAPANINMLRLLSSESRCVSVARSIVVSIADFPRLTRSGGLATVHHECVPHHESGVVGAHPQDGGGDLLGPAHPPDRLLVDDPLAAFPGVASEAVHHRRVDDAGADGVHADV